MWIAANRDPRVFVQPDPIDIAAMPTPAWCGARASIAASALRSLASSYASPSRSCWRTRRGSGSIRRARAAPPTRATVLPRLPSDSREVRPIVRIIGHDTRTTDDLVALLSAAGVETLIDVRRYPTGRRQPHLSRDDSRSISPGAAWLTNGGRGAGGRRSTPAVVHTAWRSPAFAAYSAYISTAGSAGRWPTWRSGLAPARPWRSCARRPCGGAAIGASSPTP